MAKNYLIISSEFPPGPGGIGKHTFSMVQSLLHHGCEVHILCYMDYATEEEIAAFLTAMPKGAYVHRIMREGFKTYIKYILKAISLTQTIKFDKVIVSGKFSLWAGALLKLRYGNKIRVEAVAHGSEITSPNKMRNVAVNTSLKIVDKIWPVSNFTKSLLPKKIKRDKIAVLPNGLNFHEWPEDSSEIQPFDWKGSPRLITVGNITPRKGQHRVVSILPHLVEQYPDIHYHVVGLPSHADELKALAAQLNVSDHLTVHGRLPAHQDLLRAYKSADVFCMLSENQSDGDVEGFGIAILEANIMGLPVIGSNENGIIDAVSQGKSGMLVNGDNKNEVLKALIEILSWNKETCKQNCINWAKQFDWNKLILEVIDK